MQLKIAGIHYDVTDEMQKSIEKKFQRLSSSIKDSLVSLCIRITGEPHGFLKMSCDLHLQWGALFHLEIEERDALAGTDLLFDKLAAKIKKEKEKIREHPRP